MNADAGVATGSTSAAAIAVTARILVTAHSSKFLAFGSMKASRSATAATIEFIFISLFERLISAGVLGCPADGARS